MIPSRPAPHPPFVPGQACCLVTVPGSLDAAGAMALYHAFRDDCNAVLPDVLGRQLRRARRPGTLLRGLGSERVERLRALSAGGSWLAPLAGAAGPPIVRLPRGGDTQVLMVYGVAGAGTAGTGGAAEEAAERVLDVVLAANLASGPLDLALRRRQGRARLAAPQAATIAPNWLLSAAPPEPHIEGGPGALPEPAEAPVDGGFDFPDVPLPDPAPGARPVLIAVLDAFPTPEDLAAAIARFPDNQRLAEVAASLVLQPAEVAALADVEAIHTGRATDAAPTVLDHGLFVAGIAGSIAGPAARLHGLRVLSDRGIGSVATLLSAIARVPALAAADRTAPRILVNLSLVAETPPPEAMIPWLFPQAAARRGPLLRAMPEAGRVVERLSLPLRAGIDWLVAQGIPVVAAAGNRGRLPGGARHATQEPARFDTVLAVSATGAAFASAGYANRGDMVAMGDGVATYGGDADPDGRLARRPERDGQGVDAPIGLYTAERVGAEGALNRTGWAHWAGTSFATPVIAGLAARLLHADPSLTPRGLIDAVRALAVDLDGAADLDVPVVRAVQRP